MGEKVFLISPEAPPHQFAGAGEQRVIKAGKGIRLGTLDNTKGNADHLLSFLIEGLRAQVPIASVVSRRKPASSRPAENSVLDDLVKEADCVVSAMAD